MEQRREREKMGGRKIGYFPTCSLDAYQVWKNTLMKFVKLAEKKLMSLNLEQSDVGLFPTFN